MKYVQKYNIITPKFGGASAPPSTYLSTALILMPFAALSSRGSDVQFIHVHDYHWDIQNCECSLTKDAGHVAMPLTLKSM